MTLIDISVPIRQAMPIYDRNPGVRLERALSIPRGRRLVEAVTSQPVAKLLHAPTLALKDDVQGRAA